MGDQGDSWPSVGRALLDRVGPRWLIAGAGIGGVLWLESQQPGTVERWIAASAAVSANVSSTALAVATLVAVLMAAVLVLWGSRERLRAECKAERSESSEVLREMAKATSDSSGVVLDRLGRIEARLGELERR